MHIQIMESVYCILLVLVTKTCGKFVGEKLHVLGVKEFGMHQLLMKETKQY